MMKKETFVGIIKAIQEQKQRESKFAEAIQHAFIDAGECEDFRDKPSYEPPTNTFIDTILEALSHEFVNELQSMEAAYDHINYFMYELDVMNYTFLETIDPNKPYIMQPVPSYYITKDGVKLPLSTPEELYDSLIYEMGLSRTNEV